MKFNFSTSNIIIGLLFSFFIYSCGNNPLDVDVSDIKIDLKVNRFEQDLFSQKVDITTDRVNELNKKYGSFFQDFTINVINIGHPDNPNIPINLHKFISDPDIKEAENNINKLYTDFSPYQAQLNDAFKHYRYYFPKKKIPQVITFNSGFNYAITTDESYLGIGLDMFLGKDYQAYAQLRFPQYKINSMTKQNLVIGAMTGWVSTEFELMETQANLLTEMIHQGKILYLLDALMPKTESYLKISYSEAQLNWCEQNEQTIWFYFIDNNLLYSKETKEIIKYMGETPFTQGFPEGSPGRVGHWLGWQIVKAYMEKNPTITVEQLMQQTDAQQILNQSKYKP
jgi:gliding motility-associated lipoprotein GldB